MNKTLSNAVSNGGGVRLLISGVTFLLLIVGQTTIVVSFINGLKTTITVNKVLTDADIKALRGKITENAEDIAQANGNLERARRRVEEVNTNLIGRITNDNPEAFHRQDAKELSDELCDQVRAARPDAPCVDPYELPRYKRALELLRRR